jgi:hypothetical protein
MEVESDGSEVEDGAEVSIEVGGEGEMLDSGDGRWVMDVVIVLFLFSGSGQQMKREGKGREEKGREGTYFLFVSERVRRHVSEQ